MSSGERGQGGDRLPVAHHGGVASDTQEMLGCRTRQLSESVKAPGSPLSAIGEQPSRLPAR